MKDKTSQFVLNGRAEPAAELSVLDLIRRETGKVLGADGRTTDGQSCGLAVAVNDEVVPRSAWERTRLLPGDHIEVLSAVQGG